MNFEVKEEVRLFSLGFLKENQAPVGEAIAKPGAEKVSAEERSGYQGAPLRHEKETALRKGSFPGKGYAQEEVNDQEFSAHMELHVFTAAGGFFPGRTFGTDSVGSGDPIGLFGKGQGFPEVFKQDGEGAISFQVFPDPGKDPLDLGYRLPEDLFRFHGHGGAASGLMRKSTSPVRILG